MPATRILNTIAQRVVDLQTDKRLAFPDLKKDFTTEEIDNVLGQLLGYRQAPPDKDRVAELEEEVRDLESEKEDLEREVSRLESDLEEKIESSQ